MMMMMRHQCTLTASRRFCLFSFLHLPKASHNARAFHQKSRHCASAIEAVNDGALHETETNRGTEAAAAAPQYRTGEPSRYIDRAEEHYWNTMAEDIAILTYDHKVVRPFTKGLPGHMQPQRDLVKERLAAMLQPIPLTAEEAAAQQATEPFAWKKAVPAITKLTLSISMPEAIAKQENLVYGAAALHQITGVPPQITFASKTVSKWSLKKDAPWGAVVTLLPETQAYSTFLQKWGDMVLPKIRNVGPYKADVVHHTARMAGVALPKDALRFFPEMEEFGDKFPMWATLNLLFNFNEATRDDVDARLLISSLGIPIRHR